MTRPGPDAIIYTKLTVLVRFVGIVGFVGFMLLHKGNDSIAMSSQKSAKSAISAASPDLVKQLVQALSQIRFGYLPLIVQDGKVIHMERTEKMRLASHRSCTP